MWNRRAGRPFLLRRQTRRAGRGQPALRRADSADSDYNPRAKHLHKLAAIRIESISRLLTELVAFDFVWLLRQ